MYLIGTNSVSGFPPQYCVFLTHYMEGLRKKMKREIVWKVSMSTAGSTLSSSLIPLLTDAPSTKIVFIRVTRTARLPYSWNFLFLSYFTCPLSSIQHPWHCFSLKWFSHCLSGIKVLLPLWLVFLCPFPGPYSSFWPWNGGGSPEVRPLTSFLFMLFLIHMTQSHLLSGGFRIFIFTSIIFSNYWLVWCWPPAISTWTLTHTVNKATKARLLTFLPKLASPVDFSGLVNGNSDLLTDQIKKLPMSCLTSFSYSQLNFFKIHAA